MRPGEIHAGGTLPLRSIDQNIGSGIGLSLFGLPFIGFPVFFALLLQSGAETTGNADPLVRGIFLIVFASVGVGISGYGICRMFYRAEVTVDRHRVKGKKCGIRGTEYWTEPLRSYRGVITRTEHRSGKKRGNTIHLVLLKHFRDDERDVTLVRSLDSINLRGEGERFARLLGLPVLIETADGGYEVRAAEDLDKSVAELAAEGKLEISDAPTTPLATRSVRSIDFPEGYAFEQNFKILAGILGALFFLVGLALLIGYYTIDASSLRASGWKVSGDPRAAWLAGIVLTTFGFVLMVLGPFLRLRLEVEPRLASTSLRFGSLPVATWRLPGSAIEAVKAGPHFGVRIVSDHGMLWFGFGLGESEVQHVRVATLATLARAAVAPPVEPADPKKVRAAQMVVLAELYAGNTPAAIMEKLRRLGNPESVIVEGMRNIAADGANPHAAVLEGFLGECESGAPRRSAKASHAARGYAGDKGSGVNVVRVAARILQCVVAVVVLVWFVGPTFFPQFFGNGPGSNRSVKPAVNPQREAARHYIADRYRNFDIKPAVGTGYIYIGGREIRAEAHGQDLYISLGEIRMEKQSNRTRTEYSSLGINVVATDPAYARQAKAVWNQEIRGVLDIKSPAFSLRDQVFVVPGMAAACANPCRARLLLSVQTSPTSTYAENTEFSAFRLSATTALAKPARGP